MCGPTRLFLEVIKRHKTPHHDKVVTPSGRIRNSYILAFMDNVKHICFTDLRIGKKLNALARCDYRV